MIIRTVGALLLALSLFSFGVPQALAGFGVSPPGIIEKRLVPGLVIERTIYLVQGNPQYNLPIEITLESKNIKDWIKIEPGYSLVIPKGVQQFPVKVTITVPQDAALGEYKAVMRAKTNPKTSLEAGEVSIALAGMVNIDLTVGNEVYKSYVVQKIDILDTVTGGNAMVQFAIANNGNIPAGPSGASFELFNKFGNIRLAYAELGENEMPEGRPFTEEGFTLEFPLDVRLAEGEYWGHVKFYDNGQEATVFKGIFNVTKGGFLSGLADLGVLGASPVVLWTIGALLVVGILALFAVRRVRRRRI